MVHTHIHLTTHNQGKGRSMEKRRLFPSLFSRVLLLFDKVGPDQIPPFLKTLGRRDGADVDGDEVEAGGVELEGEEVGPDLLVGSVDVGVVGGCVRWRSTLGVRAWTDTTGTYVVVVPPLCCVGVVYVSKWNGKKVSRLSMPSHKSHHHPATQNDRSIESNDLLPWRRR